MMGVAFGGPEMLFDMLAERLFFLVRVNTLCV